MDSTYLQFEIGKDKQTEQNLKVGECGQCDQLLGKISPIFRMLPKKGTKVFTNKVLCFKITPKEFKYLGYFCTKNSLPKRSKNRPIWSH